MKKILFITLFVAISSIIYPQQSGAEKVSGEYLGQNPPGMTPKVFAPGIISNGFHELGLAISPDHDELFYIMSDKDYSHYVIVTMKRVNNIWSEPEVAPFTSAYTNYALTFSPDGRELYFSSKRPTEKGGEEKKYFDLWKVKKIDNGWSEPIHVSEVSSEDQNEVNISFAANGRMYMHISIPGTPADIYMSELVDGVYQTPVKLGEEINTEYLEARPFIAPDESYLMFHSNRPGGLGVMDIYISFKKNDGTWGEPVHMGDKINSKWSDFNPYVSPDGKYLFFSSYRGHDPETFKGKNYKQLLELYRNPMNGYATLYWIDAKIIDEIKNNIKTKEAQN